MVKPTGIIKINGSLGEVSFYDSVYGPIVRRKGGPSAEQIKKSPKFERTREHNNEFKHCVHSAKLWRQGLRVYTKLSPDHTLVWRVTKLMNQLKDMDDSSARGERVVSKGLKRAEGQKLMRGFDLNSKGSLKRILKKPFKFSAGSLSMQGLVPKRDLAAPKGTTHVRLNLILSVIDFEQKKHIVTEDKAELGFDHKSRDLILSPDSGKSKGFKIYTLQMCFLQEVNGVVYPLENKQGNCLSVVSVE